MIFLKMLLQIGEYQNPFQQCVQSRKATLQISEQKSSQFICLFTQLSKQGKNPFVEYDYEIC